MLHVAQIHVRDLGAPKGAVADVGERFGEVAVGNPGAGEGAIAHAFKPGRPTLRIRTAFDVGQVDLADAGVSERAVADGRDLVGHGHGAEARAVIHRVGGNLGQAAEVDFLDVGGREAGLAHLLERLREGDLREGVARVGEHLATDFLQLRRTVVDALEDDALQSLRLTERVVADLFDALGDNDRLNGRGLECLGANLHDVVRNVHVGAVALVVQQHAFVGDFKLVVVGGAHLHARLGSANLAGFGGQRGLHGHVANVVARGNHSLGSIVLAGGHGGNAFVGTGPFDGAALVFGRDDGRNLKRLVGSHRNVFLRHDDACVGRHVGNRHGGGGGDFRV